VREQGAMYFALGEAKVPMVDVRCVGDVAAKVLANPAAHAGKVYTVTGPGNTLAEAADALSSATGKSVKYVPVTVEKMVEGMAARGADEYGIVAMRDYFTSYAHGWQSTPTSVVKDLTGKEPRTIADFARDFAHAFGGK
jgi:nucleoside-diphosphate-sugar epimerase